MADYINWHLLLAAKEQQQEKLGGHDARRLNFGGFLALYPLQFVL
jgi:hypothetical protein